MIRSIVLAATLCGLPLPAASQVMGARELPAAGQLQQPAGAAVKADIYYLAGEMGAKETYVLTIRGPASVTLFSRDGQEILSKEGTGAIRLEVVLPYTDIYTVAVARKVPAQPYTLSRRATVPTLTEAAIAEGVGFEGRYVNKAGKEITFQRCWIKPGVKVRMTWPTLIDELTIAADRTTALYVAQGATRASSGEVTYRIEGPDIIRSVRPTTEKSFEVPYTFAPIPETREPRRFTSYYCSDAAAK